jgi:hypothetical protein
MAELTHSYDQAKAPLAERRLHVQRPAWLPKPFVVTAVVTLLTAWLFPALSHQWQDRQKARELTAALVSRIGKDTSQALVTSSFITYHRFPSAGDGSRPGFNQQVFNRLDLEWRTSGAEIEAQLRAYFPNSVVREWREYSDLVWRTYRLITDNKSTRPQTLRQLRLEFDHLPGWYFEAMETPWKDRPDQAARKAYFYVSTAVLEHRAHVIDDMLRSRPEGFSTRPQDLLHDLLPFL